MTLHDLTLRVRNWLHTTHDIKRLRALDNRLLTDIGIDRDEIADRAGTQADTVSRIMGELESVGAISRKRERVAGMKESVIPKQSVGNLLLAKTKSTPSGTRMPSSLIARPPDVRCRMNATREPSGDHAADPPAKSAMIRSGTDRVPCEPVAFATKVRDPES